MSILVFVMLHFKNAPYGRYSGNEWGKSWAWIWQGSIKANAAWFLQELPSFIIPVILAVDQNRTSQLTNITNAVLLCMFCAHYFHRYVWLHVFFTC